MAQRKSSSPTSFDQVIGRRIRLLGKHPWAGESAEVLDWHPRMGMRVKLLRMDAMHGHECYVSSPQEFREEQKGVDW